MPAGTLAVVREYQARGHWVLMVGDGVNEAPTLVQAHVGTAMGALGSDVAMEAAHVVLMTDDWTPCPSSSISPGAPCEWSGGTWPSPLFTTWSG